MFLYVSVVLCLVSLVEKTICQGSIEDTEGESSTGTWSNNIVCSEQNGNCKLDESLHEELHNGGWQEVTETEDLEVDNDPEYSYSYEDYFMPNEEMFDDNDEIDENDDLEEPIEEVEPYSVHNMDDVTDDDTKWTPGNIQSSLQETVQIDEFPLDEDCEQKPDKKRRHSKKADKWKQRRKANIKLKDCCTKGKRIGLRARVYKSNNLFRACREIIRYNMPSVAHRCQWIMQTCCENKALRRYYIHTKGSL